jgi:antitoxin ParD1/3/4
MSLMRIQLGRELDRFVSELVATGFYESESEVLREGLRLLKEREDLKGVAIESLRREVEAGARDAQRGRVKPFDEGVVARIKANGRRKRAARVRPQG